jgi:hypothetical protein
MVWSSVVLLAAVVTPVYAFASRAAAAATTMMQQQQRRTWRLPNGLRTSSTASYVGYVVYYDACRVTLVQHPPVPLPSIFIL